MNKLALAIAVATAAATSASAFAEVMTFEPSLKLSYKNYYWDEDSKDKSNANGYDRDEWAHAIIADFDTGYINDMVGAVVTTGIAADLKSESRGQSNVSGNSIAAFNQAYLKGKYDLADVSFAGSLGQKKRGYETYGDSGSRLLAASSFGYDLSASYSGLTAYGSYINAHSQRESATFKEDLTNAEGNQIDSIRIIGANYELDNGLGFTAELSNSKDYLKKEFYKTYYTVQLQDGVSVALDARFGKVSEDGDLYGAMVKSDENPNAAAVFVANKGYESKYINLNATLNINNSYVGFGFNKTSDGDFVSGLFENDNDTFNSSLDQWEMYALEDEKGYFLNAGHNFADQGLAGLSVDAWYAKGKDAKDVDDFSRSEYGAFVDYSFSGQLEGLSLQYLHVSYRAKGTRNNSVGKAKTVGGLYDENINRVYLTYSVSVF